MKFQILPIIALAAFSTTAFTSLSSSCYAGGVPVNPTDSIKKADLRKDSVPNDTIAHGLLEVTVEGERVIRKPGSAEYFPTTKEKNASADAIALLKRMHIPDLLMLPSGITSASGLPVSYFVNGVPATGDDLEGMFMKNVKSVVCLENPSDAKYLGKPYVVDFIVQEYEYGGYTKLYGKAFLLSVEQFTERVNSKFSYKRMTYDVCVAPMQSKYKFDGERAVETYRLKDGDVTRTVEPTDYKLTSARYPVQFRALYRNGSTYVSNRIGYSFSNIGKQTSKGTETFSGSGFDHSTTYTTEQPDRQNALELLGSVSLVPAPQWSVSADYNLRYSHNNNYYSYVTSTPFEIDRKTREDATTATATLMATRDFGSRHKIFADAFCEIYHSNARYYGDTNDRTSYLRYGWNGRIGYSFRGNGVYVNVQGGITTEHSDVNGIRTRYTGPFGFATFNYNPNRTHNLNVKFQYSVFSPVSASSNPAVTRVSELMYSAGNPDIKPYSSMTAGATYTWECVRDMLFLNFSTDMTHLHDRFRTVYSLTDDGQAVVRGYENTGDCNQFYIGPSATLALFNKNLWINAIPSLNIYNSGKGGYIPNFSNLSYYLAGTLFLGEFNIVLSYRSPRKYANPLMDSTFKTKPSYYIQGGWGNGNVNITLLLANIFNTSWDGETVFTGSPVYEARYINMNQSYRQKIRIDVTYTFGYGKKIDRRDNLDGSVSGAQSNVSK